MSHFKSLLHNYEVLITTISQRYAIVESIDYVPYYLILLKIKQEEGLKKYLYWFVARVVCLRYILLLVAYMFNDMLYTNVIA